MNINMASFYVDEPELIFASNKRIQDPKAGLYLYGPYGKSGKRIDKVIIYAGIIGTSESINNMISFLDGMRNKLPSNSAGGIDFPGIGLEGKLKFDIQTDDQWQEVITKKEIDEIKKIPLRRDRIMQCLNSIEQKIYSISQKEPLPDIVFIPVPKEFIKLCQRENLIGEKITISDRRFKRKPTEEQLVGDYDFHNIIKVFGIKYELTTQLILPRSLIRKNSLFVQDLAQRAWNLAVAVYYKARGVPWKLTDLDNGTCYAGLDFYRELDSDGNPTMRAAVAQVFLHTGESLVLRGDPFIWSDTRNQPRLNEEQTISLKEKIISSYKKTHHENPRRLVIHKPSIFTSDEISGFKNNGNDINEIDLVTLRQSHIDWYRDGEYPIPRGIVIQATDYEYFIFTLGYIPQLKTFPKPGIPIPVQVNVANLDSSNRKMCKEIMALTKLNWNNADFCDQLPITISASSKIGEILSEARARKIENITSQYRYYM